MRVDLFVEVGWACRGRNVRDHGQGEMGRESKRLGDVLPSTEERWRITKGSVLVVSVASGGCDTIQRGFVSVSSVSFSLTAVRGLCFASPPRTSRARYRWSRTRSLCVPLFVFLLFCGNPSRCIFLAPIRCTCAFIFHSVSRLRSFFSLAW